MKIRNRLYLGSGITFVMALLFFSVVLTTAYRVSKGNTKHELLMEVELSLSQLETVTYEYLFHHEKRMEQQWNTKYVSIAKNLEAIATMVTGEEEEDLANSINAEYIDLAVIFSKVVENFKKREVLFLEGAPKEKIDATISLEQRLTAQLLIKSQSMITNTSKLGKKIHVQALKYQEIANILTLALMAALASAVILLSLHFVRALTRSMDKLTMGVKIIGEGNLDHRVVVDTKDEIGDFASAFNHMAQRRKQAEENIHQQRTVLEAINRIFKEALTCETKEDLAKTCLDVVKELTGSKIGFFGEINSAGLFDTIAISNPAWDICKVPEGKKTLVIKNMELRGVDRATMRDEKSRIVNGEESIKSHPDHVEVPEGHPPVTAFLGVPMKYEGKTIGMVGLGNKEGGYTLDDQEAVESLAVAIVEAFKRKRAEDEIHRLNEELEERVKVRTEQLEIANKDLESFSYSVSHDLRAPLRAIDGFSRIILEDYRDKVDAEGQRLLNVVTTNANKMGQLIDDILQFSRMGRKEMEMSEIDMNELATTVMNELKRDANGRHINAEIKDLPGACGDKPMIRQVFANLLSNAVKFTGTREVATVELSGNIEGDEAIYCVQDNGVGFDMEYRDKLFDVFQRLHSPEEFEGTGAGLSIVKRIIEKHGGRIWGEGKVGEGAAFYFSLPRSGSWI